MRPLATTALGLAAGIIVGFLAMEIVARIAVSTGGGDLPLPVAVIIGFLVPVLAVVGLVVGLVIGLSGHRTRRSPSGAGSPELPTEGER